MSDPTLYELMESPCEWTDYSCECIVRMAHDEIERLQARVEALEGVYEAAVEVDKTCTIESCKSPTGDEPLRFEQALALAATEQEGET